MAGCELPPARGSARRAGTGGRWRVRWAVEAAATGAAGRSRAGAIVPTDGAVLGRHSQGAVAVTTTVLPDGIVVVVTCGHDETIQIWDLAHGHRAGRPLAGHDGSVWSVATTVLPDGTAAAVTVGEDATVRVWDMVAARQRGPSMVDHRGGVVSLATATLPGGSSRSPVATTPRSGSGIWRRAPDG